MRVETIRDGNRVLGFIAIDSEIGGRSCGGLRMMPDVSAEELQLLARAMTFKYGFLAIPQGGAKAGIIGDPLAPPEVRNRALEDFGRAAAPILSSGRYVPGTDMGTDNDSVRVVLSAAGVAAPRRALRGSRSAFYTALGVFLAADEILKSRGGRLRGMTAIIEGLGNVGGNLKKLLEAAGVQVLGWSTLKQAVYSGEAIPVPQLLEQPADLLFPCARHHSIRGENADRIAASVICPGANCPVTPEAEQILVRRGVMVFPDFASNCGGVLGGTMEFAGIPAPEIEGFFRQHLSERFAAMLARSTPPTIRSDAEAFALRRFEEVRTRAQSHSPARKLFRAGLDLFRHGLLPSALVRPLALRYFEGRLSRNL